MKEVERVGYNGWVGVKREGGEKMKIVQEEGGGGGWGAVAFWGKASAINFQIKIRMGGGSEDFESNCPHPFTPPHTRVPVKYFSDLW
jgi:hypothetical protein